MIQKIKNLFKIAKLLSTVDSGALRFGTAEMLGKNQKVLLFSPYGLMHCPPENSLALVWSQQGQESNGIGMADDPANRTLKNLEPGEVALGNYETGAYILFDADGTCTINADAVKIISSTLKHNDINIGDTHVHSQGSDSAGDKEQDTDGPH